jgi:RNA polymerase sigma-70 factor (ECF subfamily)
MKAAPPEPDDVALLQAVAQQDEHALAALYDRFSGVVFGLVMRMVRSRAEAEEVLQEAFWQVWNRAGDYRAELGSPSCWIITIARRKAIDRVRATARHLRRIDDAQRARVEDDFMPPVGIESAHATDLSQAVRLALEKLNLEERRAIALAFFDGLTHEEIARAMGAPVGTIKARIRRGMLKLKTPLAALRSN